MTTDQGGGPAGGAARAEPELFSVTGSHHEYQGKVVSVRVDDVVMPGGSVARREVVEHARAVAVVALDISRGEQENPDLVLLEQYRHPLRRRLWELPARLMDVPGESPLACAQRELAEEAGLAATDWDVLIDLAPSPGFSAETIRVFVARGLSAVDRSEIRDEEADLRVIRLPLQWALQAVLDGSVVNAIAVAGVLAAAQVVQHAYRERSADDGWTQGEARINAGPTVDRAPALPGALD